jgi:hypothetical protein
MPMNIHELPAMNFRPRTSGNESCTRIARVAVLSNL